MSDKWVPLYINEKVENDKVNDIEKEYEKELELETKKETKKETNNKIGMVYTMNDEQRERIRKNILPLFTAKEKAEIKEMAKELNELLKEEEKA